MIGCKDCLWTLQGLQGRTIVVVYCERCHLFFVPSGQREIDGRHWIQVFKMVSWRYEIDSTVDVKKLMRCDLMAPYVYVDQDRCPVCVSTHTRDPIPTIVTSFFSEHTHIKGAIRNMLTHNEVVTWQRKLLNRCGRDKELKEICDYFLKRKGAKKP